MIKQKGPRVLIVDDETFIAELFSQFMLELGYEVYSASDGEQALEMIESLRPDIVVTDMHMPKIDGNDLYKRVIAKDPSYSKKFIFVSGSNLDATVEKFLRESKCEVVVKPFDVKDLAEIIEKKLRTQQG
jgi:CheY-like chemotaxis protein